MNPIPNRQKKSFTYMKHVLIGAIVFLVLASCSTRKDRAVNRAYHQTTTKFNVLFNGEEAISAGIEAEIASHQPNFWEQLPVEPFPLVDLFTLNPKENANFSRGEEKAVIAVQKHSMQFGNEQRNQQIDEAYMLLGKARYYNGRYLQALDAFNYIIDQLPNTSSINKAQLWKAKVFIQLLQEQRAIAIFKDLLSNSELTLAESAEASAYLAKAHLTLNQHQQATQPLYNAATFTKGNATRARYYYLLGQLHDKLEHRDSAAVAYQRVIDLNRRIPRIYWIHAKLNQLNTSQSDEESVQKQYRNLTINEENKTYLDKIHFSHALYSLSTNDTISAKELINASLRTNTKDKILKGLAYETMGNVLFEENQFVLSGAYLDSTLQVLSPKTRTYRKIKRKRDKLNDIIDYETTRKTTDSLLVLIDKTPEEQNAIFESFIKTLKTADSLQLVQQERQQELAANTSFFDSDFYFYNRSLRTRGESEFYRIWGNIKKTDNWRYSSLQSVAFTPDETVPEDEVEEVEPVDPRYIVETYTSQIPPPEAKDSLSQVRNAAYFDAGLAYKEQFGAYPQAKDRLQTLLSLDTKYNLPSLYHLYQIELETAGDQAAAYKNRIITAYPDSQYAMILQNPEAMEEALNRFEERYSALEDRFKAQAFEEVIDECFIAMLSLQDETLRSRFALLRAHAIGRLDGMTAYQTALSEVALSFPNQQVGEEASKRLLEIKNLTPTDAEEGDRYLVYFVFDRKDHDATKQTQAKVKETIFSQGLQRTLSVTIDVLDRQTELLVIQRFTSQEQATDYRDNLLRIHPELREIKNFVALTSALRDILIFKDVTKQ
jgi:tetratricopeptide (TPR) repeat protein